MRLFNGWEHFIYRYEEDATYDQGHLGSIFNWPARSPVQQVEQANDHNLQD
jgi:hypothetical protein